MNENCRGNSRTALQTSDIHQKSMFTQLMPLFLVATPFPQRSYFTSKIFRRIYRTPSIFKKKGKGVEVWKREKKPLSNRLHPPITSPPKASKKPTHCDPDMINVNLAPFCDHPSLPTPTPTTFATLL